nr:lysophospholipid acyltransferase family protein [Lacticaseibacillus parakribbianus]
MNPVIANIKDAVAQGQFNTKVEVNDPTLAPEEEHNLLNAFVSNRGTWRYSLNNMIARTAMNMTTRVKAHDLTIHGRANLANLTGGAIVTSNHFSPWENMVVRKGLGMHRLFIVSQATNLKMPGTLGYMMNYADTLPIGKNVDYLGHAFPELLEQALDAGHRVLIYPEQEMWYQYKKPRPPKRGAYYYAARLNVPIVSCFVAMTPRARLTAPDFHAVGYSMYIEPLIYPDPKLSVRENSLNMMQQDYRQKVAAYEKAYGEKLTYRFSPADIAGWTGR